MRIGLITDVHEHVANLRACLQALHKAGCDRIIQLGDLIDRNEHTKEVVRLLNDAGVTEGVWGNHDAGLMFDPNPHMLDRYPADVRAFLRNQSASLHLTLPTTPDNPPLLVYASHIAPNLDPHDIASLWRHEPPPATAEELLPIFDARPERILIAGHHHVWYAATPIGPTEWDGRSTLELVETERWYIIINAARDGYAAVLDTTEKTVEPISVERTSK